MDAKGKVLGRHDGIWNFTIGQRKGLGVAGGVPLYVVAIRPDQNEVVLGEKELLLARGLRAVDLNIIGGVMPRRALVKTRSSSDAVPGAVGFDGVELEIIFDEPHFAVTPGQSVVVYDGDFVVGGGVYQRGDKPLIPGPAGGLSAD